MGYDAHGFTMAEILVALAIAAVIMAAIFTVYRSQQTSYITQEQVAVMHQNVRAAMYHMEREIRMAGCDPTGKAGAGIVTASANLIRFTEDIRGRYSNNPDDGDTDDPNEDITYTLADPDDDGDTDLVRNTGGGNKLVAENISSLNFQYQDGDGNTTSTLSAIRFVQITLTGTTQDNKNESTVTIRIHCRNLEM
jgi:type IV pilus assembly protein PilW